MKAMRYAAVMAMLGLAACVPATPEGEAIELPEGVLALVAPGQDVNSARIEADGCYWYLHRGPVESTYLPLLTRENRMICTRPQA
ncbi:MAG: hypothetical protein RIB61_00010 [Roseicyclus sp.]|jgi:hypothetical protein